VYVNYLRRKLKDPAPGSLIRTVRGQGYVVPSEAELAASLPAILTADLEAAPLPVVQVH
jgi:DNA-binding winged helix-turn-helix (wHTH) protein